MKTVNRKILLSILITLVVSTGCSSRNIRKQTRYLKAPIERTFTFANNEHFPLTGDHPVEYGSPLVTDSTYIFPSVTEGIVSRDKSTFNLKWRIRTKNGMNSTPVLDDNYVYFGANDGYFYSVDADTGQIRWKYDTKVPIVSKAIVEKGKVYFQSSDDVLYCLESATGKWLWHYKRTINTPTTIRGNSTPFIDKDQIFAGFSDGFLVSLRAKDGNTLWETKIHKGSKFTDVDAEPVSDGRILYVPSFDGGLYALEPNSGKIIWYSDIGGSKRILLDDSDNSKSLFLPTSDGRVLSMNRETGKVNWSFELDLGTPTSILSHGPFLAFGSSRQYFYVIRKNDGFLEYRFNAGLRSGFFGSPVKSGDQELIIYSEFGNLYGFKWKDRKQIGSI